MLLKPSQSVRQKINLTDTFTFVDLEYVKKLCHSRIDLFCGRDEQKEVSCDTSLCKEDAAAKCNELKKEVKIDFDMRNTQNSTVCYVTIITLSCFITYIIILLNHYY